MTARLMLNFYLLGERPFKWLKGCMVALVFCEHVLLIYDTVCCVISSCKMNYNGFQEK